MKTIETVVYTFDELSDLAKETAREWYRNQNWKYGYAWMDEINDSFEKVCEEVAEPLANIEDEISGARLYAWINNNLSHLWTNPVYFSKHEDGQKKKSTWAYKYDKCTKYRRSKIQVQNEIDNCPFTGVCYDHDFLQPVIDFMKKPNANTSNIDLSNEIKNLLDSVTENEQEWQDSDEYIDDNIMANEYEFTEDGNRF